MASPTTPIVVGVGQVCDRLGDDDYRGLSPLDITAEAARTALADAGADEDLASQIDVVVASRTFEDSNPTGKTVFGKPNNRPLALARRLGIEPARSVWAPAGGNVPQYLVGEMTQQIASGAARAVLLAGGEALSTSRDLQARGEQVDWSETVDGPVEDRGIGMDGMLAEEIMAHGVYGAPGMYALCENARRARLGLSREDYAAEMGRLFAPFSAVAAGNPYASTHERRSPQELTTVSETNRWIAEPYPQRLVARDQVNQGAAVLLTSVGAAHELGIPEDRWVYLHGHADVRERTMLERQDLGASPAAALAVEAALERAGVGVAELGYLDLYSCFPIAVFAVCDALGLDADDPRGLTLTGGLPYFGGPGNNYSMHGIAAMVDRLRGDPGSWGLVGANGGFLSKYSAGVYSTRPADFTSPTDAPLQARVDALPAPRVEERPAGPATIETYTIVYGRDRRPAVAVVLGRLASDGARFVASAPTDDPETLEGMIAEDPLGRSIVVRSDEALPRFRLDAAAG